MCTNQINYNNEIESALPVQVERIMQWSMLGLQLTVISRQWWALWCWADLSSGLNCRGEGTMRRAGKRRAGAAPAI